MAERAWTWAKLSAEQRQMLERSEQPLGVDYLLAYQGTDTPRPGDDRTALDGLQPASLSDSQLDCLQGLENQLHSVVVAYRKR